MDDFHSYRTGQRILGDLMGYWEGIYNGVRWDIEFKNGRFYAEIYFTPSVISAWQSRRQAADWIVKRIKERSR